MKLVESTMAQVNPSNDAKKRKLLIVQDLNYAKNLAANDEKIRQRALKYLKRYLQQRSEGNNLTEENFKVLWKGLFFSMWMSDKPLVQEECAENIAYLIHCLSYNHAMEFFRVGMITLQNEWFGIDQHRLDKFMMFLRRFLRQTLFVLKKVNFKKHHNEIFTEILQKTILSTTEMAPMGLFMHFTEIYLEELAKVADGKLQTLRTVDFVKPYIFKLAFAEDRRIIEWINKFIFTHLMKQHKLGLEYEEKYNIWKAQRFVGSINQIQKIIVSDDEAEASDDTNMYSNENRPLDPRAGKVDVELPQIKFDSKEIAENFIKFKTDQKTSKLTRHFLTQWAERFQKLYQGAYPLGTKKIEKKKNQLKNYDTNVTKAAKRLIKFEEKLLQRDRKQKKRKLDNTEYKDAPESKKIKKNDNGKLEQEINMIEEAELKRLQKKVKLTGTKQLDKKSTLKKKNKLNKDQKKLSSNTEIDYCFERNSGFWFVTPESSRNSIGSNNSNKEDPNNDVTKEIWNISEIIKEGHKSNFKIETGEYEIFIPSKKHIKKLKKIKGENEVKDVLNKLQGKNNTNKSNNSTPVKSSSVTSNTKRVKINTKLNVSQEIDDHIQQVISSPSIPFDSSKKPGKPLLKTPIKASPINPFYKRKIF